MDRGAIAIASELFECRHYPSAVATCTSALDEDPACVPLLLVRARCLLALRREEDAQADLRAVVRLDPRCALAYRLLGELAARRDENASAAIFLREALRLDPGDQDARDWLVVVDPSADAAAPLGPRQTAPRITLEPVRTATSARSLSAPAARFARGTQSPDDERPTKPTRGPQARPGRLFTPTPELATGARHAAPATETVALRANGLAIGSAQIAQATAVDPPPPFADAREAPTARSRPPSTPPPIPPRRAPATTLTGRPPPPAPRRPLPRPVHRAQTELPGFGEYLVAEGILTRERLRAAQAYQRSMKVQLSTAIVTLGLASPQRLELASVAHQSSQPARAL